MYMWDLNVAEEADIVCHPLSEVPLRRMIHSTSASEGENINEYESGAAKFYSY